MRETVAANTTVDGVRTLFVIILKQILDHWLFSHTDKHNWCYYLHIAISFSTL